MNTKNKVILISIAVIVVCAMLAGDETNMSQDAQWYASCEADLTVIETDMLQMQKDIASGDEGRLAMSARYFRDDSKAAYDTSKQYTVSPELAYAKMEYEAAMLDYSRAGECVMNHDYEAARDYLASGDVHIAMVRTVI